MVSITVRPNQLYVHFEVIYAPVGFRLQTPMGQVNCLCPSNAPTHLQTTTREGLCKLLLVRTYVVISFFRSSPQQL